MNYNYSNISTKDNCIYINELKISNFSFMPKWYEIRCYLNGKCDNSEGCVCFKTEDLLHYFNSLEDFKSKPTVKSIIKQLDFHNLLKYVGGESTYPLSKNKGLGRFVHIKLRDLFICYREHFDLCRSNGNNNDINDFEKQLKEAFILYIAPEAEYEDEEVEDYWDTRYKEEKKPKKRVKRGIRS